MLRQSHVWRDKGTPSGSVKVPFASQPVCPKGFVPIPFAKLLIVYPISDHHIL